MLVIKECSLRSEYSHPLLSALEDEVDVFRDTRGCEITEEQFEELIVKAAVGLCPEESVLFRRLAREVFVEPLPTPEKSVDFTPPGGEFPSYEAALKGLERHEHLWVCYDKRLHELAAELVENINDKSKIQGGASEVVLHGMSFNEDSTDYLQAVVYVLKTVVPYRSDSRWQAVVQRLEFACSEIGLL